MARFILICIFAICPVAVYADSASLAIHSGTAFFITPEYAITNEHLVHGGCKQIILQVHGKDWALAQVAVLDPEHDLALLHTPHWPRDLARLRSDADSLKVDDNVVSLGYTKEAVATGHYEISPARIINPHDSAGDSHMLQFSNSTKEGFSGGALLDEKGNVVGVVKGIVQIYNVQSINGTLGERHLSAQVDEAINLNTLKAFLAANNIPFRSAHFNEKQATDVDFTVNVQCVF